MSTPPQLVDTLRATLGFQAQGERAGNLTAGRGTLDGRAVRVALCVIERRGTHSNPFVAVFNLSGKAKGKA